MNAIQVVIMDCIMVHFSPVSRFNIKLTKLKGDFRRSFITLIDDSIQTAQVLTAKFLTVQFIALDLIFLPITIT